MKSLGGHPRGDVLVQDDGFGILKQMFAKGYATGHAGETTFPEYCERPETADDAKDVEITFSDKAGGEFYKQVQNAIDEGDTQPFFDFSQMPKDWDVPAEQPTLRGSFLSSAVNELFFANFLAATQDEIGVHRVRIDTVKTDAGKVYGVIFRLDEAKGNVVFLVFPGREVSVEMFYLQTQAACFFNKQKQFIKRYLIVVVQFEKTNHRSDRWRIPRLFESAAKRVARP
jgi:hypothetical protein